MATADEKRAYIAKLASKFVGKDAIIEGSVNDRGEQLERFLSIFSGWSPGLFWCAAYVSALSLYTDKYFNSGPNSKYLSSGSQYKGAGTFSTKVEDAYPGLAVSWKNVSEDGGHLGVIIDVDVKKNIIIIGEGNTGSTNIGGQKRNGTTSAVKTYTFNEIAQPKKGRYFRAYVKIWEESDESIRNSMIQRPQLMAQSINIDNYATPSSNNQSTITQSNTKETIQQDYSGLFLFSGANINNVGTEKELSKPITSTQDQKKSESTIPIDKQNISLT